MHNGCICIYVFLCLSTGRLLIIPHLKLEGSSYRFTAHVSNSEFDWVTFTNFIATIQELRLFPDILLNRLDTCFTKAS